MRLKRRVVTRCSPNSYVAYDRFFFSNVFDIRSMIGHSRVLCVMQSVAQNEIDQLKVALQSEQQQQLDDERNEQQRLRHSGRSNFSRNRNIIKTVVASSIWFVQRARPLRRRRSVCVQRSKPRVFICPDLHTS